MQKALKQQAGRIEPLCTPQDHACANRGFESEIARLKTEIANLKANRPTGPPFDVPVLISLNEVCRLTTLSRTAINRWRSLGLFPSAVPLGDKRVAFIMGEVEQWICDRITERDRSKAALEQEISPTT